MAKSIQSIKNECVSIRDASAANENTAQRVGGALVAIVDNLEEFSNKYDNLDIAVEGDEHLEISFSNGVAFFSIPVATQSSLGLLSAADKKKIDDFLEYLSQKAADSATVVKSGDSFTLRLVNSKSNQFFPVSLPLATVSAAGIMSAGDKRRINSLGGNRKSVTFIDLRTNHWLKVAHIHGTPYNLEDVTIKVFFEQANKYDSVDLKIGGNPQFLKIQQVGRLHSSSVIFGEAAAVRSNSNGGFDVVVMVKITTMPPTNHLQRASINTLQIHSIYGGIFNVVPEWLPDGPNAASYGEKDIIELTRND